MGPEFLRIAFDDQIFRRQPRGGISRYFQDLTVGLKASPGVGLEAIPRAQVVHATFYGGRPHKLKSNQKLVSSLFDLTPERHPEHFFLPQLRSPHGNKRGWLQASDLILSISQASADDLSFFQPRLHAHVQVIHLATGLGMVKPTVVQRLNNRRFWLLVGKRHAYKNGLTLLRAVHRLLPSTSIPLLVCAGGGQWSRQEQQWISQAMLSDQILQLPADDGELAWLYRHAEAVLVPSMAEGFSLPLIEALVCNTPVLASDLEAHREVAGAYAALLPALNAEAWAESLAAASHAPFPSPKERLGEEQFTNLCSHYSMQRMVGEHLAAYRQLIADC